MFYFDRKILTTDCACYMSHVNVCAVYTRPLSRQNDKTTGPWFNIKMSSYQYRKSHFGDKTILRPSYLQNGISYTGKMTSLYWIRAQNETKPADATWQLLTESLRSAFPALTPHSTPNHHTLAAPLVLFSNAGVSQAPASAGREIFQVTIIEL